MHSARRGRTWVGVVLALGFAFLYLPVLILIVYSFNAGRLVTVWAGFSLRWYGELFHDRQLMGALFNSLKIAVSSASAGLVLGTMAALVLVRMGAFRGRTLFAGMITAPLVMPEVITGLSLLLLFVTLEQVLGWPQGRGLLTVWLAHTTFCMAYAAIVVSARLGETDRSVEEAAMDLGATRVKVFFVITLPMIAPSLMAGWLLAFTLSFDDLVIASFVSGPGATTLPMEVFSSVRLGVSPKVNALSALLVAAVAAVTALLAWLSWRQAGGSRSRQAQDAGEGSTGGGPRS